MSQWAKFYKLRVGDSYPAYCKKRYAPFLKHINDYDSLSEEGCGIATISKIVYEHGKNYTAFDKCSEQLSLANKNLIGMEISLKQGNILSHKYNKSPDIIISHGVLEHFNDRNIKKIIKRQLKSCSKLIHYVPLDKWITPSFGDERLLPVSYWDNLVNPDCIETFNDNKDAVLMWSK
jgi:hypothetical protein